MKVQPAFSEHATQEVQEAYRKIAQAFGLSHPPLFFQYIGAFPDYLLYITDSIVSNVSHPKLQTFITQLCSFSDEIFRDSFTPSEDMREFIERYKLSPDMYYFKKDIERITRSNAAIMLLFLALREAVKGWAVAVKKLPSAASTTREEVAPNIQEELIYGDMLTLITQNNKQSQSENQTQILIESGGLVKRDGQAVEVALLPAYLQLCQEGFSELLKKKEFLFFRVEAERTALRMLEFLPEKVMSPINIVLELAKKYPNFPDLLYMLSEQFPTSSVQRWLFSGFMKRGLI